MILLHNKKCNKEGCGSRRITVFQDHLFCLDCNSLLDHVKPSQRRKHRNRVKDLLAKTERREARNPVGFLKKKGVKK